MYEAAKSASFSLKNFSFWFIYKVTRRQSTSNFQKNEHFYSLIRKRMYVYQGVRNAVLCFLVTFVLRFVLLPYSNEAIFSWTFKFEITFWILNSTINPFVSNATLLYILKTSENFTVFLCFQGAEKGCIWNIWVNSTIANLKHDDHFPRLCHCLKVV